MSWMAHIEKKNSPKFYKLSILQAFRKQTFSMFPFIVLLCFTVVLPNLVPRDFPCPGNEVDYYLYFEASLNLQVSSPQNIKHTF